MTKLTYEEFRKALDAGMSNGSAACCCVGPQDNDEYCPCNMNTLNILTEDGQEKLKQVWREHKLLPRSELIAKLTEAPISEFRKKRLELIAKKNSADRPQG
jgi:hypothetical protein